MTIVRAERSWRRASASGKLCSLLFAGWRGGRLPGSLAWATSLLRAKRSTALSSESRLRTLNSYGKLQSERLNDARRRVYSELAGRQEQVPDSEYPGQMKTITVRPTIEEVYAGVDRIVRIESREANLYGLDAPKRSEVAAAVVGQAISDEELDIQLARLTPEEIDTFMMLTRKMQGRWVEPPAIDEGSVETTATTVQSNGAGS